jgi:hypothetical protein
MMKATITELEERARVLAERIASSNAEFHASLPLWERLCWLRSVNRRAETSLQYVNKQIELLKTDGKAANQNT